MLHVIPNSSTCAHCGEHLPDPSGGNWTVSFEGAALPELAFGHWVAGKFTCEGSPAALAFAAKLAAAVEEQKRAEQLSAARTRAWQALVARRKHEDTFDDVTMADTDGGAFVAYETEFMKLRAAEDAAADALIAMGEG